MLPNSLATKHGHWTQHEHDRSKPSS